VNIISNYSNVDGKIMNSVISALKLIIIQSLFFMIINVVLGSGIGGWEWGGGIIIFLPHFLPLI
jgi:hypothetical protein